ncbi:MAG: hypothetical protein V1792_15470 [Pseudomonadota bacterium]
MSEILSTIDLIMERTRGMALSKEEKEDLRKEDLRRKARGLRLRVMDDPSACDDILQALQRDAAEDRSLLESLLWEELVREMPLDARVFGHLDLLEKMPQAGKTGPLLREARESFKNASKDRTKDRKKILIREAKRLAGLGISGSAVVPKLPPDSDTGGELTRAIEKFRGQLLKTAADSA